MTSLNFARWWSDKSSITFEHRQLHFWDIWIFQNYFERLDRLMKKYFFSYQEKRIHLNLFLKDYFRYFYLYILSCSCLENNDRDFIARSLTIKTCKKIKTKIETKFNCRGSKVVERSRAQKLPTLFCRVSIVWISLSVSNSFHYSLLVNAHDLFS